MLYYTALSRLCTAVRGRIALINLPCAFISYCSKAFVDCKSLQRPFEGYGSESTLLDGALTRKHFLAHARRKTGGVMRARTHPRERCLISQFVAVKVTCAAVYRRRD